MLRQHPVTRRRYDLAGKVIQSVSFLINTRFHNGCKCRTDVEIESEDDDEDSASTPSTTYAGPTRMTQRQAALAGMVDPAEHIVLGTSI